MRERKKVKDNKNLVKEKSDKNNLKLNFNIIAFICIIIFCISICPVTLQNDTFYTIKIGEDIIKNKTIDMQDHYSMHELPYTYPHWAYDVLIYLFYNIGGMTGVYVSTIIFTCILGIVMYLVSVKLSKNKPISLFLTIGAMYLMRGFVAARAQLVTFILFLATILLIEKFLENKKAKYAIGIILISIAIANLHCAVWPFFFVIFLPYIAEYLIFTIVDSNFIHKIKLKIYSFNIKSLNKKLEKENIEENKEKLKEKINNIIEKQKLENKNNVLILQKREEKRKNPYRILYNKNTNTKWLILVMVICALTGLLTPLGDTPYTYLYKTMKGNTTEHISEHLPMTLINSKPILIVIVSVLAILIFTDTKLSLRDLFFLAGLTLLMLMTRRQESMLILLGCSIVARLLSNLFNKYDKEGLKNLEELICSSLGAIATILVVVLLSVVEIKPKLKDKYINEKSYPVAAANFIKENLDYKNIRLFNEYNYGSYLLYQGIPVFIDSRADLYAPEFNGKRNKDGKYEGKDIFNEYMKTSGLSRNHETTFDKYDITHVILYKSSKLSKLLSKETGYNEIYSDEKFIIFERY